jgi:hypothetical protein
VTQEEILKRSQETSRLGWESRKKARQFNFKNVSKSELGERYRALCDLIPPEPNEFKQASPHYRIDDGFHDWQRQYEAECKAIEEELLHRR